MPLRKQETVKTNKWKGRSNLNNWSLGECNAQNSLKTYSLKICYHQTMRSKLHYEMMTIYKFIVNRHKQILNISIKQNQQQKKRLTR